jgi:hypothetical protein
MTLHPFCDPYVWENPKVLLVTGFSVRKHKEGACASEYVNHVIFIYTLFGLAGMVTSAFVHSPYVLASFLGFATLYCLPTFGALATLQRQKEGFTDANTNRDNYQGLGYNDKDKGNYDAWRKSGGATEVYDVIGMGAAPATVTLPSARNPFMNVLIDEIKYNPTRPMAASITDPSVKIGLDEFFRTEFNADPTDVFGKTQSQRQFVAMPSTSIPNDVDSYQNWLYRIPGKTCKEGGREACLPGTDGAALPWLNVSP